MKPHEAAFIAVAVLFRTASLAAVFFGLFAVMMPLLGFMGRFSGEVALGLLRILVVYLIAAVALWVAAKPAASLVIRGLDVGTPKA